MATEGKIWGKGPDGKDIYKYKLTAGDGAYVELSSLGAAIVSVCVPDKDGALGDVVLGYDKAEDYLADGPCAGKCPGRFANRIAKGHFTLDGKEYTLPVNNGPNHLHGGPQGFQNKVWDSRIDGQAVEFLYFSADGEAGYPANLKVVARYEWGDDHALKLTFTAVTDGATVLNLTNHAYFNLSAFKENVLGHELCLAASEYLPTDPTLIPLGDSEPVAGTPMDFVTPKPIGRDIEADFPALKYGKGYDNCFVIDDYTPGQLEKAASLYCPATGRALDVYTTQPGVQIYTGNWLNGCPAGKHGLTYHDYDAVAIECQHFPDTPNKPDYPTAELRPGQTYEEAIVFEFSVR